ncbi:hypothetical protein LZL87_009090 [Fusarium oxysporum]|nr:hypothetical protein LZL87_009090 [Fusarium oxysporum]
MGDLKKIKTKLRGGDTEAAQDGSNFKTRNIRYTQTKRFQLPVPIKSWDRSLDCTQPASVCPQIVPSRLDSVTGPITAGKTQSEECLHLTVTAPLKALRDGHKRPVMVFLHGGAYVSGGGDLDAYSSIGLAQRNLVAINITYRLGLFGCMSIPETALCENRTV